MERYWQKLHLTKALRPNFEPQEIELLICNNVSIYHGDTKVHRKGTSILTSHRVMWLSPPNYAGGQVAMAMHLSLVARVSCKAGLWGVSSPKITVMLGPLRAVEKGRQVPRQAPAPGYIRLSFHEATRDAYFKHMQAALGSKAWLEQPKPQAPVKQGFTTTSAGIQGIMRKMEHNKMEEDKALGEAFSDLDALMKHAGTIVAMADKYSAAHRNAEGTKKGEDEHFSSLLSSMGIPNPVTRKSAGTAYHVQLCRQLADFVQEPLERAGGMLLLTDVYCLFNRARGTELVSPDDLLHACRLLESNRLPVLLRTFESGVMVVQSASHSDEAMSQTILRLLDQNGPLTCLMLSRLLGVSLTVAQQHIHMAEQRMCICRDESIEATRYYPNMFPSWSQ